MQAASPPKTPKNRPRRGIVVALTVLASVLAFVAVFSIWANRQLLETDNWVDTSSKLLEDEAIRSELANFITDELYANVDVQGELEAALPPDLKGLAGPAAGGIRQLVDELANEALQRPAVQTAWEGINRTTHEELLALVENGSGDGVTLDLGSIVTQIGDQAGLDVADKLPPDVGQLEVLPPEKLTQARDVVNLLKNLALWTTTVALLLFALAVYLARGWRREALRAVGFSFIVVGIAVSVVRGLAGNAVVASLASTASVEPAVRDTYEIGTSLLADGAGAMLFYGIVIVLGAWLAGPTGVAQRARRGLAPFMERSEIAYGTLLAILLLLFWWSPTEGFRRLGFAILIIVLLALGWEVLRRQTRREYPDETWDKGTERWRGAAQSLLDRRKHGDG